MGTPLSRLILRTVRLARSTSASVEEVAAAAEEVHLGLLTEEQAQTVLDMTSLSLRSLVATVVAEDPSASRSWMVGSACRRVGIPGKVVARAFDHYASETAAPVA